MARRNLTGRPTVAYGSSRPGFPGMAQSPHPGVRNSFRIHTRPGPALVTDNRVDNRGYAAR